MSARLTLIAGVVSDLATRSGEEEFVRSANQQAVGIGAAGALAAGGMAGTAIGASMAAASAGDSVEFFSCKIGARLIEGRFSKVSFKDGDEVSFVTSQESGRSLALAAIRPRDQLLWITPHCSRGPKSHADFAIRMFFLLNLALLALLGGFIGTMAVRNLESVDSDFLMFWSSLLCANAIVMSGYYSIRFYRQWLPISRQAEQIFAALGYHDPSRVDLPRDHKRYCKAHGIKWPYLTDGPWIYRYRDPRQ